MQQKQKRYLDDIKKNENREDKLIREVQEDIGQALYEFNTSMDDIHKTLSNLLKSK